MPCASRAPLQGADFPGLARQLQQELLELRVVCVRRHPRLLGFEGVNLVAEVIAVSIECSQARTRPRRRSGRRREKKTAGELALIRQLRVFRPELAVRLVESLGLRLR